MAELTFTYGTMAAGKSTLALQLCWQLREGRSDVALWTFGDRSAEGMVTSRIGIEAEAEAIEPHADLAGPIEQLFSDNIRILVIDEVQFASVEQIDALARLVDDHGIDVHAFGLSADFLLNDLPRLRAALLRRGLGPRTAAHVIVLVRAQGTMQRARGQWGGGPRRRPVLLRQCARGRGVLPGALSHALPARSVERLEEGGAEFVEFARHVALSRGDHRERL